MMDFFDVVAHRHSIRAFKTVDVEREKIDRILETANRAPSAGDLQAYRIYLVRKQEHLAALARAALGQTFVCRAPLALVFCAVPARSAAKYGRRGQQLYALQDATIACAHAQLAATALGLGSTWVGAFDEEAVRQAIGIAPNEIPIAILPVGYPAEAPGPTPRRSLTDLVHEVS
jgi:nitroreductase